MKLDELRLGVGPLTDQIYIGSIDKKNPHLWSKKADITSGFIGALMEWCPVGTIRMVNDNHGNEYEIEIRCVKARGEA